MPNGKGMTATIALVDDDRNILTSVSLALQAEGFTTRVYADGAAGLKGCLENPPDLVVVDIKMPRMDWMGMLRRLREKSDLPVIFLTSKDEEIDELFGLKMGADDFIRKPFSQRLLVERVKAVLRRVAAEATDWLAPGGRLLSETSERQAPAAVAAFTEAGLKARVAVSQEWSAHVVIGVRDEAP